MILSILILILSVLVLTGLFFYRKEIKGWFKKNWKKASAVVIVSSVASAGVMLIPLGAQPPSGGTIIGDSVIWENEYARLEVHPHTSTNIITQTQYANLTWKYPDNMIDVAFRFQDALQGEKDIWIWRNISHDVRVPDYGWKNANYTLYNISDVEVINESVANSSGLDFGDIPSVYYRKGNASYWDEDFGEWINGTFNIGFDDFSPKPMNPDETTFFYEYWGITGYHTEQQYWFDWDSIKHLFIHEYYTSFPGHYYIIPNIPVVQDKSYLLKWQYNIPLVDFKSSGKWDLMAKLSSDTVEESLNSGRYVMIDPWWNSDWGYYKYITVSNEKADYQTLINISYSSGGDVDCEGHAQSDFDDLRFVYDNITELPYWFESVVSDSYVHVWVNNTGNYSGFQMFYGNASATNNSDGNTTFDFFDNFNYGSQPDSNKWTETDPNSLVDVSGGELRIIRTAPGSAAYCLLYSVPYFTYNFSMDIRTITYDDYAATGGSSHLTYHKLCLDPTEYLGMGPGYSYNGTHERIYLRRYISGAGADGDGVLYYPWGSYRIVSAWCDGVTHGIRINRSLADEDNLYQAAAITRAGQLRGTFADQNADSTFDYDIRYDWLLVRKYVNISAPSFTFGSEQSPPDNTPPWMNITFAGNPGDKGGPKHPTNHSGVWNSSLIADHGYYTNNSWQQENFINITVNVTDDVAVDTVLLHLLNESTWDNSTYSFTQIAGTDDWYCNATTLGNFNYSFDILANDTSNNGNTSVWDKQAYNVSDYTTLTRRWIRLCGTVEPLNNTIVYLHKVFNHGPTVLKPDHHTHDQGDSSFTHDQGLFNESLPTDDGNQTIFCSSTIAGWYDKTLTIENQDIDNIYAHIWWNQTDAGQDLEIGCGFGERGCWGAAKINNTWNSTEDTAKSNMTEYINNWGFSAYFTNGTFDFHLECDKYDLLTPASVTDNSIYNFLFGSKSGGGSKFFSNRSMMSFFIINVPDNNTLGGWDNDSDGLNNWEEMFVTWTDPYTSDTDNDGVSDYNENLSGSDPNNYTSTTEPSLATSVNTITPYNQTTSPLTVTATSSGGTPDNVSLWYRYSDDNSTWEAGGGGGMYNFGKENGTGSSGLNIKDAMIGGSKAYGIEFTPEYNGTANTIHVWLTSDVNVDVKCGLYDNTTRTFIVNGNTSSQVVNTGGASNYLEHIFYYNDTQPEVNTSTVYLVVAWSDDNGATSKIRGDANSGYLAQDNVGTDYSALGGVFPAAFGQTATVPTAVAIYVNYTASGGNGGSGWLNFGNDSTVPYSWSFNFPNGTGYYQFYSIGYTSGLDDEDAPTSPDNDTRCNYTFTPWSNTAPTVEGMTPANASTDQELYVILSAWVNDTDGNNSKCTWFVSDDDVTYDNIDENTSVLDEQIYYNYSGLSYGTTYYWYITADDTHDNTTSEIYHFTTSAVAWSNTAPVVGEMDPANNSAGNMSYAILTCNVTDDDGNNTDCNWFVSSDGSSFDNVQLNASTTNDTIRYNYTGLASYHTYYWYVTGEDEYDNTTGAVFDFTTAHTTVVRTYGIDYFVWLGQNISAYEIIRLIPGLEDAGENYIAVWRMA